MSTKKWTLPAILAIILLVAVLYGVTAKAQTDCEMKMEKVAHDKLKVWVPTACMPPASDRKEMFGFYNGVVYETKVGPFGWEEEGEFSTITLIFTGFPFPPEVLGVILWHDTYEVAAYGSYGMQSLTLYDVVITQFAPTFKFEALSISPLNHIVLEDVAIAWSDGFYDNYYPMDWVPNPETGGATAIDVHTFEGVPSNIVVWVITTDGSGNYYLGLGGLNAIYANWLYLPLVIAEYDDTCLPGANICN